MIPVLKRGKDKKAVSYRSISPFSCVINSLERMVNQCLIWYLETENIVTTEQIGFRQFCITEDHATYLSQELEYPFQQ